MQIRFHDIVEEEIAQSSDWYFVRSEGSAMRFVAEVEEAIQRILESPDRFELIRKGLRACSLKKFPFRVIYLYRQSESSIYIISVAHDSRRPGYWETRLDD